MSETPEVDTPPVTVVPVFPVTTLVMVVPLPLVIWAIEDEEVVVMVVVVAEELEAVLLLLLLLMPLLLPLLFIDGLRRTPPPRDPCWACPCPPWLCIL